MTEPIAAVSWANDNQLSVSTAAGGETIRHEQTPDYSGAKIIYTITERAAGTPPDTWVLPVSGGTPVKYHRRWRRIRRTRRRRALARRDALPDRSPAAQLQAPQHLRRLDTTAASRALVHEDVKQTFWSMTGDARGGSQASPDGKWISFVSDQDGWDHLYVAPASGGAPVQITKGQFEAWRSSWSPDARGSRSTRTRDRTRAIASFAWRRSAPIPRKRRLRRSRRAAAPTPIRSGHPTDGRSSTSTPIRRTRPTSTSSTRRRPARSRCG